MAGENAITPNSVILALFSLFLGALLGDLAIDWRFKTFFWAIVIGLGVYLIEAFTGLARRLDSVTSYCAWVPPLLIGAIALCLAAAFLRPHSRFQMLNFEPLVPSFSSGQLATSLAEFINRGREDGRVVIDNYVWTDVESLPPDTPTEQQMRRENELFAAFIGQSAVRNAHPRHTIIPNDRLWMIAQGRRLPDEDVQGFQNGTRTFYFIGTIKHRDSRGIRYTDYCQYVVKDSATHAIGVFPCLVHNGGRTE